MSEVDAPSSREPAVGLWASLKEAMHGTERDLTGLPVKRAIFLLAVPMVLEMVMESIFAVVDVFFVGRLGADAVATVGLTESLLTIIYAAAAGLSIGATALVSRRIGEKDPERAARTAVQAIGLGVLLAIPVAVAGVVFARPLMELMGGSPWVLEHGVRYTQVMLGGMGSVLLLFLINAIFRGAGDAAIAMRVLWLANAINIVLAPMLIFGLGPFPELGVMGAAVATTFGRSCGVVYQLYRLARGSGRLQVRREHLRLEPGTMLAMLKLSGAGTAQSLVNTTSWVVLARIVATFGSAAVAGYTIAMRIVLFALLPSWGLANAAATLVGQSLGAKQPERGERAVWTAGVINAVFLGSLGLLFIVFAQPLVSAFSPDAAVVDYGAHALRIISGGFLFYAFGMVLTQSFNGAGDTATPTLINIFCFWLLELPLAWVLSGPVGMGPSGVFLALTVAFSMLAIVSAILFRRGTWKLREV
ncbi:MATE family efflux transporter [Myxococcus sp. CA051A]|uniref:MATE family efflux transporter n=1 Tax=unclassified Myxococcus TaxID=2648731 RepID=UPI00157A95C2|nr:MULTISPECIES: MATE family efflux transporter [unclassified Myxococcus]NTX10942.1 MATE family efflux transporter [Myxococcus sp. CA056]NTX52102.1 MATE family efflux transporter [Myxococcus sp. CA039A]NTX60218.1 MATE family efflux transporter [Myxococcus sp. CA051A]